MAQFDILICSSGPGVQIWDCLRSIREHTEDYRVIFLNNNADPNTLGAALEGLTSMPHFIVDSPENIGEVKAINALFALSTASYVVTMNDDIEVASGWLQSMRRLFDLPNVGIAANVVDHSGGLGAMNVKGYYQWDGGPAKGDAFVEKDLIPFYCTMFSRKILREVGYWSEEFEHGFGSDDDYCHRARAAGFRIAVDLRTTIHHGWRTTVKKVYGDKMDEYQRRAQELLAKKYG